MEKKGLSDLLREIGDNRLTYQVLNQDMTHAQIRPDHAKITFATDASFAGAMVRGEKRAFVVWVDEAEAQTAAQRLGIHTYSEEGK